MDRAQYIAITSHYSSCWRIAEIWKILKIPEDTVLRYFIKELFWKISQISQKNTNGGDVSTIPGKIIGTQ